MIRLWFKGWSPQVHHRGVSPTGCLDHLTVSLSSLSLLSLFSLLCEHTVISSARPPLPDIKSVNSSSTHALDMRVLLAVLALCAAATAAAVEPRSWYALTADVFSTEQENLLYKTCDFRGIYVRALPL